MAKRYSKNYSNYILKKKYQYSTKGTIWERDWVTIGAQHQIEKGKRPFFGDSGFLFTDNSFPSTQKRHEFGKVVAEWLYDDVKNSRDDVNKVTTNYISNDLRDFAYYGSCVELVRSSIFNIINNFPACVSSTDRMVCLIEDSENGGLSVRDCNNISEEEVDDIMAYNMVSNPFGINFSTENLKEEEVKNSMRFMSLSALQYEIVTSKKNGEDVRITPVVSYTVNKAEEISPDKCPDIYIIATAIISSGIGNTGFSIEFTILSSYGKIVIVENSAFANGNRKFIELRPIEPVIDAYFDNLSGFEKLLLRTDTAPLYKNTFLKMFETDNGIRYAYRDYIWPMINDYCIDITSPAYSAFVNGLLDTATDFDEIWCDNLWMRMTHEALRNYDWTYTKDYNDGDEQENVKGGNRLESLIRIYGRVFDDIKRNIDGIKFTAKISYDGYNNMPTAEISDRLEYNGWELYTTIPNFNTNNDTDENLSTVFLTYDDVATKGEEEKPKWFYAKSPLDVNAASNDIDFLRSLALSSKYILKSKGTVNSVEMVMGLFGIGAEESESDVYYNITEKYYISDTRKMSEKKEIADLVHYDRQNWFYEDPYEGVPFGEAELHDTRVIVPFYDSDKYYKGEFTFQSNGGWFKKSTDTSIETDYEETLSYLNVVSNFEGLLSVNTFSLEKFGENENVPPSDIYYVVDPSDYIKYNEKAAQNISHYFYIKDVYNPQLPSSWNPILREYIDESEWITTDAYEQLPLYKLREDDGIDKSGSGLPETIDSEQEFEELNKYVFVCGGEIIHVINGDDTELGYVNDDCEWAENNNGAELLFNTSDNTQIPTEHPLYSMGVHRISDLNTLSDAVYKEIGYIPKRCIKFRLDGTGVTINADMWLSLSKDKREDYSIIEDAFRSGILDNYVKTFDDSDPIDDFSLQKLYSVYNKLSISSYIDAKELYYQPKDLYTLVSYDTGGGQTVSRYYRRYPGDEGLYERALYLDSILSTNIGNNPHVGFGRYDLGNEYRAYMTNPFKYYQDNYKLTDDVFESMDEYGFDITEYTTQNNEKNLKGAKVKNVADTFKCAIGYSAQISVEEWEELSDEEKVGWTREILSIVDGVIKYKYVKNITAEEYNEMEDGDEKSMYKESMTKIYQRGKYRDSEDTEDKSEYEIAGVEDSPEPSPSYYMNSKVITIEFNNTNELFSEYFIDTMSKYVMQVIPSTAIVIVLFK